MKIRFNSLSVRLFILFFICSLILLILLTATYYKRSTAQINVKVGEIALKNVSQASEHLDFLLKSYISLSKSVIGNPDIQRLIARGETNPALQTINERTITNVLGAIYYSWDDVAGIHVISNEGAVYSYGSKMTQVIDTSWPGRDWYDALRRSNGDMVWLGIKPQSIIDLNERQPVFAFGRQLFDLNQTRPIGIVLVEMRSTMIQNILANLNIAGNGSQYIIDRDNALVAMSEAVLTSELAIDPWHQLKEDEYGAIIEKNEHFIVLAKQKQAEWSIVSITPKTEVMAEVNETTQFLLMMLTILVVLSLGLALFISKTISAPVKQVIREMRHVERGNFDIMLQVKSFDEINVLAAGFNRMVNRINSLVERVRTVSESEKNAEIHSLQSQVNPHFLYNTLDMIYWMLDEKDNERLGDVILALSRMFRYSSSWEETSGITLHDELEQIESYMFIIQTKIGDSLRYETNIEERWLAMKLPKMCLQPIVENAVIYGLHNLEDDREGVIRIETEQQDQYMFIHITDNGEGMTEPKLQQLTESLWQITKQIASRQLAIDDQSDKAGLLLSSMPSKESLSGIGLENVHRRLALRFGAEYGLRLRSVEGQGTRVTIAVPYLHESYQ
ncbi:sensor histidine kinase [Paenibacillaceae bacterium]|nr:sensor histidine kinase [Paenibacillaceae bacterium]